MDSERCGSKKRKRSSRGRDSEQIKKRRRKGRSGRYAEERQRRRQRRRRRRRHRRRHRQKRMGSPIGAKKVESSFYSPSPSSSLFSKSSTSVCEDGGHVRASCIKSSAEEESQSIISRLPLHLILQHLPSRKLCQLRCVCKAWNLMLGGVASVAGDPCIDKGNEECWFITARPKHGFKTWDFTAFSSRNGPFKQQSSSFSPFPLPLPNPRHRELCSLLGGRNHRLSRVVRRMDICPLALVTMGGLMCALIRGEREAFSLVVFNCLTGSLKVLPPPCNPHHFFPPSCNPLWDMSMAFDSRDSSRYYVMLSSRPLVNCNISRPLHLEVYDSKHESWKLGRPLDLVPVTSLPLWDGNFFSLIVDNTTMSVGAYDVEHDVWSIVHAARIIRSQVDLLCAMLKYKRRLLVGQPLRPAEDVHTCRGFVVWELQLSTSSKMGTWVEIARTPQHLWRSLPYDEWSFNLFTGGSFFCMVYKEWDDLLCGCKKRGQSRPPLVFDVAQNSWYFLPVNIKSDCILVHEPRLSAHV